MERQALYKDSKIPMLSKCYFLSKLIYRFNASQIKTPVGCFVAIDKLALKFIWRRKRLEEPAQHKEEQKLKD